MSSILPLLKSLGELITADLEILNSDVCDESRAQHRNARIAQDSLSASSGQEQDCLRNIGMFATGDASFS